MTTKFFSLTELEDMCPWERDVYKTLLQNWVEEEKNKKNQGTTL